MTERITNERLSERERLQQAAIIFAAGILRLRRPGPLSLDIAEKNSAQQRASCLEVSGETVLSVHTG
jgi:hypothetical protein